MDFRMIASGAVGGTVACVAMVLLGSGPHDAPRNAATMISAAPLGAYQPEPSTPVPNGYHVSGEAIVPNNYHPSHMHATPYGYVPNGYHASWQAPPPYAVGYGPRAPGYPYPYPYPSYTVAPYPVHHVHYHYHHTVPTPPAPPPGEGGPE